MSFPGLDTGLSADEAGGARQTQLAGEAAVAFEPAGLDEDAGAALLDAAVALVEIGVGFEDVAGRGEGGLDLGAERGLVGLDREQPEHKSGLRFDPARPPIPAQRSRPDVALLPLQPPPPAHARGAHPEAQTGFPMRRSSGDRREHPGPKIDRGRFRHACLPPLRQTA